MIEVGISLEEDAAFPSYGTAGAAGADLYAAEDQIIPPGEARLIRTGVVIELPEGYAGFIQPRSGLALKYQVTVLNTPGLIDSDYRGELKVLVINHGHDPFEVNVRDRIAQLVVQSVERCHFVIKDLGGTERGVGGFGSTGV
jgi:dUTP pyrophosphatase